MSLCRNASRGSVGTSASIIDASGSDGATRQSLGLTGFETREFSGLDESLKPCQRLTVKATENGATKSFEVMVRIDTPEELQYLSQRRHLPDLLS